jgi:HPt (histidine-containing phosphotransfer) domain-containing protein
MRIRDAPHQYVHVPVLVFRSVPIQSVADFDRPVFDRLIEDIGDETAFEALSLFLSETGSQLLRMNELLANGDRTRLKREAHSLKSASATLGFLNFSATAKQLESIAETPGAAELPELLANLDRQFLAARRAAPQLMPENRDSDRSI